MRERFLEANKKCVTHSDLGSAACRLPAGAGVGTVAEIVFLLDVSEILDRVNYLWASSGRTTELCLRCPTVSAPYSLS